MRYSCFSAITAMLLVASAASGAVENNSKQAVAAKAIGQLGQEMRKKLTDSMQKNGPAGSIDVCAKDAPAISSRIKNQMGVTLKRTSLRVRNPKNAPDQAELQVLSIAAAASAGETLPQGVNVFPNDTHRFYKVITMEQNCLKCHGDSTTMSEAVRKELATLYPEDKAVGYKEGDIRGIISATVK